jgi:hypothetical protein
MPSRPCHKTSHQPKSLSLWYLRDLIVCAKAPPAKNDCRTVSRDAKTRRRHMFRAYIRVYDAHRRQHAVPVGWWCPDCHAFMDDLR